MKNKRVSVVNVILVILLLASTIFIGSLLVTIERLEGSLFSLALGEKLPELKLVALDNTNLNTSSFSQGVSVLFCFKIPCSSCNSNLSSWNNLAGYFGDRIRVIGIIPDGASEAFQLQEGKRVNYPLCMPVDREAFARQMRLKINMAQTIVIYNNEVIAVKFGTLSGDDLKSLVSTIEALIKNP